MDNLLLEDKTAEMTAARTYSRLLTMTDMIKDTHMVIGLLSIFMIINTIVSIATLIAVLIR